MIKIWRSWKSAFGEFTREFKPDRDECRTAVETYTDGELARIRSSGFNAIWIHAQINHLVKTSVFSDLGDSAEELQSGVDRLIKRAAGHGIGVYLYMQIPRGLPREHPLWKNHPECAGMPDMFEDEKGEPVIMLPMCVSVPKVRDYLGEAARELARKIPGMAGVILITAAEYVSHCHGRGGRVVPDGARWKTVPVDCPRCSKRTPAETVSEMIRVVSEGIHGISPEADVIVWNWSWTLFEESPCLGMIRSLPGDILLLADFERGGKSRFMGKEIIVNEYSLSYAGPSEQFQAVYSAVRARGMKMIAKLQLGTTHELATVPNLPLIGSIREKAIRLLSLDLEGFMGCWNFGNMPSANIEAFHYFLKNPEKRTEDFASVYFPGCRANRVAKAWQRFADAMKFYPFNNAWLYFGPTNFSPALPFEPGPVSKLAAGRSWLPEPVRGDDISKAFAFYSPAEVIRALEKLTGLWDNASELLREGLASSASVHAKEELSDALACGCLFRSALNFVRSYQLKSRWRETDLEPWREVALSELDNLKKLLPVAEQDSRVGYHIEAHERLFTPCQIRKKIEKLEEINSFACKLQS
ncbi:MAG: hypothetical protein BWY31_01538 [Lentisphaerae bacterium ADurb.Bin242]|nr:MAG: hypothetical protein BWY31_01538 [Lentisphaerae bacterium ADurb.Bin242]